MAAKLRADRIPEMLATTQTRIFCLPARCLKKDLMFCMGLKIYEYHYHQRRHHESWAAISFSKRTLLHGVNYAKRNA
jgi:hypothetical protein